MNFLFRRSHVFRAVIVLAAVFLCATAALAQADPRIVGGQEADPGEWPWQVALVQSGGDTYNGQFCGGSLIAANWVLTAAHCVYTSDTGDLDVVAGIHDLVTPDPGFVRVQLAEIIVHTGWDNGTKDNDVALLRLATPIPERAGSASQLPIQYVHLVAGAIGPLTGATTTVTGWGNRTPGGSDYPARLHEVEVLVIANGDCSGAYSNLTDNMLCAGVPGGGKDSCQGDSGGPLVYNNSGEWQQAGIVSFGIGCAEADYPGVYTRVSRYVDWITNAMNPLVPTNFAYVPAILHVPPAPPPPPLPTLVAPANGAALNTLIPTFEWRMPPAGEDEVLSFCLSFSPDPADTGCQYGGGYHEEDELQVWSNLEPATTYYWRIGIVEDGDYDNIRFSETWQFTTGSGGVILPPPVLLSPADGVSISLSDAIFEWSAVAGSVEYQLLTCEYFGGCYIWFTPGTALDLSLEDYAFVSGDYYWLVAARNDYAWGEGSIERDFTFEESARGGNAPAGRPLWTTFAADGHIQMMARD